MSHVDDVVEAFLAAGAPECASGEIVDIGSGRALTIRETVERVIAEIGTTVRPSFGARPDRTQEWDHIADPAPARARLVWTARTHLADGLRETTDWLQRRAVAAST